LKVVSNAGPLIALGKPGRLELLIKLYGEFLIRIAPDYQLSFLSTMRYFCAESLVVVNLPHG
jgi:predicted nucleic acid-binding protein